MISTSSLERMVAMISEKQEEIDVLHKENETLTKELNELKEQIKTLILTNAALTKELNELKEQMKKGIRYYPENFIEESSHTIELAMGMFESGDVAPISQYYVIESDKILWGAIYQNKTKVFETEKEAWDFAANGGAL